MRTVVFRFRCPGCRKTATLLPDGMLPRMQHSLDTIAPTIESYVTTADSYRQVAARGLGVASSDWGTPDAPEPAPSTICRWVHRFALGAQVWWPIVAREVQARRQAAIRPLDAPDMTAKARTSPRRSDLQAAWYLLWLLGLLLELLQQPQSRWPQALLLAAHRPANLDHTGWFVRAPP